MDGSLLTNEKQLPIGFWEMEEHLAALGIKLVIASGRPFHNIAKVFQKIAHRTYFICDNGSYVSHNKEELLISSLDKLKVQEFIEISRSISNAFPILCSKDIAYIEDANTEFKNEVLKYYQECKLVDNLMKVKDTVLKFTLCDLVDSETNSYPFYTAYNDDFKIAVAGKIWLDITNYSATKGNAVKIIQDNLNISPQETLVFGDYLNDLEMIQDAGYSYAMKNAHHDIINAAKLTTKYDNDNSGVLKTIEEAIFKV